MKFNTAMVQALKTGASQINAPWAHLGAVVQVESNGVVFADIAGKPNLPVIRYEGHYVYRRTSGTLREVLVAAKLASPKVGGVKNPAAQEDCYEMIERCAAICKTHKASTSIPYESCSWGIGQVMGANWADLGYRDCAAFVTDVCSGFAGQLRVMLAFIKFNSIDDELRDGRFASFARVYNGPSYAANKYDTKMIAAAKKIANDYAVTVPGPTPAVVIAKPDGLLRVGSKGRRVRELQALLVTAGFVVKVDGDFGDTTRDVLKAFQKAHALTADGIYGPKTEDALAFYRSNDAAVVLPGHQNVTDLPEVKKGLFGGGTVAATLVAAQKTMESTVEKLADFTTLPWVEGIQSALIIGASGAAMIGLGFGLYGYWKSKQTVEV